MNAVQPAPARTFESYSASFLRHMQAEGRASETIRHYGIVIRQLAAFLAERGMPTDPTVVSREHLEEFFLELRATKSAKTVVVRHEHLGSFFSWLVAEDERSDYPIRKIKVQPAPPPPAPCLTDGQITRLLKAAKAMTPPWRARRDTALIRLLLDTGIRVGELAGLRLDDVEWHGPQSTSRLYIRAGKGGRARHVPFGFRASRDLDRWLRVRGDRADPRASALFVGELGRALPARALRRLVAETGEAAGLYDVHPHMFRHTFAHLWLRAGGSEGDLMEICGWANRAMLDRYAASMKSERARQAHRRFGPGDRF